MDDGQPLALAALDLSDLVVAHEVHVDLHTGAAIARVPIPTTAGRGGIGPSLALEYGFTAGNTPFGVGWSLVGLPAVTLDASSALPRFDGDDEFAFGGQSLVPALERFGDGWRPRTTERAKASSSRSTGSSTSASRCASNGGSRLRPAWTQWRLRDRHNVLTVFGLAADGSSRVADPDNPERVFAWLPEARFDAYGTACEYGAEDTRLPRSPVRAERRRRAQPQRHLKRIRYGNSRPVAPDVPVPASNRWLFELVLDYGDHTADPPSPDPDRDWPARADPYSTCRSGFEVRTWRLCRRLLMFAPLRRTGGATLVAETALGHRSDPTGSVLESVTCTRFRREGAETRRRSLPPLRFGYSEASLGTELRSVPAETLENVPSGLSVPLPARRPPRRGAPGHPG